MSRHARRVQRTSFTPGSDSDQSPTLVRLGWIALGPVVMVLAWCGIAGTEAWTLGYFDLSFAGAAVLTGLMRWLDIARYDGTTSAGEPVQPGTLPWYLLGLSMVAGAAWLCAQSVSI